ncbi:MAG TPA: winged helix-turn-helix domain-containing protein [Segetibacter sp.]|nr:winged helix-turn-helix domain-containing protein [Segetibacter sp.]
MANAKIIQVKESSGELKRLQKNQPLIIIKRLNMLLELKKHGQNGISKRALASIVGVDPNSIQKWRTIYAKGGIADILSHGRKGFKPSLLTLEEHKKIEQKLSQPKNALRGYKELMQWIKEELGKEIKYTTVVEYAKRHFGSKIKVARKTHVLKDEEKVEAFKKTSVKSSRKPFLK